MNCKNCDSEMRTMVDVTMIFPSRFDHLLTKQVVRRKDAEIYATMWDRASHICPKCGTTYSGTSTAWDKLEQQIAELVELLEWAQQRILPKDPLHQEIDEAINKHKQGN